MADFDVMCALYVSLRRYLRRDLAEELREIYSRHDTDMDGRLTFEELQSLFRNCAPDVSETNVIRLYQEGTRVDQG
jgi:Ca2+-binding EF-hand superfamily protein